MVNSLKDEGLHADTGEKEFAQAAYTVDDVYRLHHEGADKAASVLVQWVEEAVCGRVQQPSHLPCHALLALSGMPSSRNHNRNRHCNCDRNCDPNPDRSLNNGLLLVHTRPVRMQGRDKIMEHT